MRTKIGRGKFLDQFFWREKAVMQKKNTWQDFSLCVSNQGTKQGKKDDSPCHDFQLGTLCLQTRHVMLTNYTGSICQQSTLNLSMKRAIFAPKTRFSWPLLLLCLSGQFAKSLTIRQIQKRQNLEPSRPLAAKKPQNCSHNRSLCRKIFTFSYKYGKL